MKHKLRQLLTLILAMSMVLSLLSANVWAADMSEDSSDLSAMSTVEPQEDENEDNTEPQETEGEEEKESEKKSAPEENTKGEESQEEEETQSEPEQNTEGKEPQKEKDTQSNPEEEPEEEPEAESKVEEVAEAASEAKATAQDLPKVKTKAMKKQMNLTAMATGSTETLLTTITATAKEQASYSTANVATVSFSYTAGGSSAYLANWGWWGYGWIATVTPADGYTITKCVFYDDANRTDTDSSSPFVVETTEEDKTPRINGTPIDGGSYQSKGIKKIEVYGYASKAAQTITASDVTATDGDTDKSVTASVTTPTTGGGAISYAVKTGSENYIDVAADGKLTIKAVPPTDGKAYVIVTAAETDDYAETTKEVTVTISKATPVITLAEDSFTYDGSPKRIIQSVTYPGGTDLYLRVDCLTSYKNKIYWAKYTGSSDLTNVFAPTNAGTYSVYYFVGTPDNPEGGTRVDGQTRIDKALPKSDNFTFTAPSSLNYDGTAKTATVTIKDGVIGMGEVTVRYYSDEDRYNEVAECKNPGTYYVGIDVDNGENYNSDERVYDWYDDSWKFTITKADPTASAPTGLTATYGQTLADVTLPNGWTWVDSAQSVGSVISPAATFKANFAGNDNYNAASNVDVTVTVSKADPTAPTGLTATYGQTLANVTLPDGWTWADSTQSVGNVVDPAATFKANFAGDDNHNAASNVDVTVTVGKADPTVPTGLTATYGQTLANVTLPDGWTWADSTQSVGNVVDPAATFKANFAGDDNHNAASNVDVTVTVGKATPTLTNISAGAITYGQALSASTVSGTATGVNNEEVTGTWAWTTDTTKPAVSNSDATQYDVTFTSSDSNYNNATGKASLTVNPKEVGLDWSNTSFTYDKQSHSPTASASNLEAADEGKVSVTVTGGQTNAGEHTATASELSGDSAANYTLPAANTTTFTIAKKEVGLNWANTSFTYDGQAHAPTASATGVESGDTCTVTVTGEQTNAGENYTATATSLSNSNYKLPSEVTQNFTIAPKAITATADNKSTSYKNNLAALTFTLSDGALAQGDSEASLKITASTEATKDSPKGTYPITLAKGQDSNPNYDVTLNNGTYTINEADATITASAYNGTYDGQEHSITVTVKDEAHNIVDLVKQLFGLNNTPEATVYYSTVSIDDALNQKNTTAPTRKDVGETTVYYAVEFGGNYKAEPPVTGSQKVTITAAASSATAPTANNRIYDGTEQPLVNVDDSTLVGGTMQYALGENATTAPTSVWGTSIPTATNAGTYYVWYKVKGDANHTDTDAVCVTVTVSRPYTPTPTPTPTTPTEQYTIPVTSEETVQVGAQISEGNAVVSEITPETLEKVTDDESGGSNADTVTIDLSGATQEVTSVELSKKSVENLASVTEKENTPDTATVKLSDTSVEFDAAALKAVSEQAVGDSVKLVVDDMAQSKLNEKQQEALSKFESVKPFEAYMESNGKKISDFKGGKATVSRKFTPEDGKNLLHYHLYYLNPNGALERLKTWLADGWLFSDLYHFSEYAIVYDETQVNATATEPEPQPEPEPEPEPEPATPTDISYDSLSDKEKKQADEVAKALGVDKDTAAQMVKTAQELGVSMDTVKLSGSALAKMDVDSSDPKGTDFGKLTARVTKRTNSALTLKWTKQKNADGYLIYGNKCGKGNKMKLLKTIKKNGTVSYTQKKLKKGTYYKYMVVAYKNVNGKKMPIAASVVVHVPTKGGKTTVSKSVKVTNTKKKAITKATVKKGKTFQLKASEVKDEKKLKVKTHRKIKFESSNKAIATVNAKGKITGKKKGKATVWAYAQNGIFKAIQVTVK